MGKLGAYVRLARPANAALAGLGALVGAVGAVGREIDPSPALFAMAAATLGVAGGNALNDALDAEIDRTAHPRRPIPRGDVTARAARRVGFTLIAAGMAAAGLVNLATAALGLVLGLALLLYEFYAKDAGLLGHLIVSYNAGAIFLLGGTATLGGPFDFTRPTIDSGLAVPLAMAALALLLNLSRELYKAAEDVGHDAGRRRTFAVAQGEKASRALALMMAWVAAGASIGAAPFFGRVYLYLVAPLAALLLAVPFLGTPRRSRAALKAGMWWGLVAFLVPKLI